MTLPDMVSYMDINTHLQLPDVTGSKINDYLQLFEQKLGRKAQDMYYGNFLKSVRHARKHDHTYIRGRVSAEMVKRCVYTVDIKLDDYGIVQESQCAVGMGPDAHCKHVMLVLFSLTKAS